MRKRYLSVFGLHPGASWEEVEEAYQDMLAVWDPARYPDDQHLRDKASSMRREVDHAYKELERLYGSTINRVLPRFGRRSATEGEAKQQKPPQAAVSFLIGIVLGLLIMIAGVMVTSPQQNAIAKNRQPTFIIATQPLSEAFLPQTDSVPGDSKTEQQQEQAPQQETKTEPVSLLFIEPTAEEKEEPRAPALEEDNAEHVLGDVQEPEEAVTGEPENYAFKDKVHVLDGDGIVAHRYRPMTPKLINASIACDLEKVRTLIESGTEIDTADDRGDTGLAWATKRGCVAVAEYMIEKGASINTKAANGFTPYIWARVYGRDTIARLLQKAGAKINSGAYWWRYDEEQHEILLKRAEEDYCRGRLCGREGGSKLSTDVNL